MLYGPETAYPTQRAGVKALLKSIVNNTSGRGPIYQWEILDEQHADQALPCQLQPRRWCYDQADLGRRPWQRDQPYQPDLLNRLAQNAA
jgi:hypothetical protein